MKPVRGEPVSEGEERVSVTRKEDSGGLWHKLHLHSSTGSRWTDGRIDEQTERGKGETHKHRYSQALLHRLLLTQCRCKRKGRVPEDEKTHNIKRSDVRETEEIRPKLHSTD